VSTAADRRMRGARNVVIDLLGLGAPAPIVDLPVSAIAGQSAAGGIGADPDGEVIVPFGGAATLVVGEAEPGVVYRVRATGGATSLSSRRAEGEGTGDRLDLLVPRVDESVTFSVEATTPRGRRATLAARPEVRVGLDRSIAFAVAGTEAADAAPAVVDHGTRVTMVLARSQEAVSYALVLARPGEVPDEPSATQAPPAGLAGTGGPIELTSEPLAEDVVVRVRADRSYGKGRRQAVLLDHAVPVHVRADRALAVTLAPPVSDGRGTPAVTVARAQAGVRYDLVVGAVPDDGFRLGPVTDATTATVDADGTPVRVAVPVPGRLWRSVPGHAPAGVSGMGTGRDLVLALPPLVADATVVVRAVRQHGDGETGFASAVPLATPLLALVRPVADPPLTVEARIAGGRLVALALDGGQPGVFYALSTGKDALGEFYFHQLDPADPTRNKGLGRIGIGIDLAVAADLAPAAPPPRPRTTLSRPLSGTLPLTLAVAARRATTGLRAPVAAAVPIAPPPAVAVTRHADTGVGVKVDPAAPDARHVLLVDGVRRGEPVAGGSGPLALATGPLAPDAVVELLILDPPVAGIAVARRVALG